MKPRLTGLRHVFISFEGVGGAGKTTQARLLYDALVADGRQAVLTREPGGTPLGEHIRELILGNDQLGSEAETLLFAAARAELVADVVRPALDADVSVVCDRFVDSSLVYQGVVRGVGIETVLRINEIATNGLFPDRTFLLLVDIEAAARRRKWADRIETADVRLKRALTEAYLEVASLYPSRFILVDGDRSAADIAKEVREHVRALL